jgi:hypothetical protein
MITFTDLRCRRLVQLVEESWKGCTAEIITSGEDRISFRIRSIGGRYRTGKITLDANSKIDRDWLADEIQRSLFSYSAAV